MCTSDCFSWILAFTVAKHDTTWKTNAFVFSIFWTCLIKTTTNDCKSLNVNRIRSKNFQKGVSEQQLACRWTCSMNLKLGTFEGSLASCKKWYPPGYATRNKFLVRNIHKATIVLSLFFANCVNATTGTSPSFKITYFLVTRRKCATAFLQPVRPVQAWAQQTQNLPETS